MKTPMIIERFVLLVIIVAAGVMLFRWQQAQRRQRINQQATNDPILANLKVGHPAIIYFTTPYCVPCKTVQQPALEQLQTEMGDAIQIMRIDATEAPDTAQRWGVMSAPTTFILDSQHQARHINHGAVDAHRLRQQITSLSA